MAPTLGRRKIPKPLPLPGKKSRDTLGTRVIHRDGTLIMEKTAIQVYTSCMVRKNLVASIFFMDFRSWVFRFFPLRLLLIFLLFFLSTAFLSAQEHLEGDWVRFALTGRAYMPEWGASSALESENPLLISRYDPGKALDEDPATAWVEGVPGPGSGEKYYIALPSPRGTWIYKRLREKPEPFREELSRERVQGQGICGSTC